VRRLGHQQLARVRVAGVGRGQRLQRPEIALHRLDAARELADHLVELLDRPRLKRHLHLEVDDSSLERRPVRPVFRHLPFVRRSPPHDKPRTPGYPPRPVPEFIAIPDPGQPAGRVRIDRRGPLAEPGQGPPLVLLGGMTQTLSSWGGQLRPLAQDRQVVAYEARGQGQTELSVADVGPQRHVDDFVALMDALDLAQVDLCGFSFGARVALAIAASRPTRVRRLIVTGVSAGRGALGRVIVRAWRAALATGDLEALGWLSLADTLGPAYLQKHEAMLPAMVQAVQDRNSYAGIRALFEQTLGDDETSPWHPTVLAPQISSPALLLAGAHDRLAPAADLATLAALFPTPAEHHVVPDVGHTVPIEAPEVWRAHVRRFLA